MGKPCTNYYLCTGGNQIYYSKECVMSKVCIYYDVIIINLHSKEQTGQARLQPVYFVCVNDFIQTLASKYKLTYHQTFMNPSQSHYWYNTPAAIAPTRGWREMRRG